MDLDSWFPNFDLFIMQLLPALILVTFVIILFEFWIRRKKSKKSKKKMDWMDTMIWITSVYFFIPLYRIAQYLTGEKEYETLVRELFVDDFYNYMVLMLMVGIVGAMFIFLQKFGKGSEGAEQ